MGSIPTAGIFYLFVIKNKTFISDTHYILHINSVWKNKYINFTIFLGAGGLVGVGADEPSLVQVRADSPNIPTRHQRVRVVGSSPIKVTNYNFTKYNKLSKCK